MNNTSISNTNYCKPEYTNQYSYTEYDQPYYIYTSATTDASSIYNNTKMQEYNTTQTYQCVPMPKIEYGPYAKKSTDDIIKWYDPKGYYIDIEKMKQWQIDPTTIPNNDPPWWEQFKINPMSDDNQKIAPNTEKEEKKPEPQPVIDKGRSFDMDDDFDF